MSQEISNIENNSDENMTINNSENNNIESTISDITPENNTNNSTENLEAQTPISQENQAENSNLVHNEEEDKSEEILKGKAKKEKLKNERIEKLNEIFDELKGIKENNGTIEVEVISRIKGGLRVKYKDVEIFLPTSHFTLKRNAPENELQEAIGNKYEVEIHEFEESETGRKAVIVSRKNLLSKSFFENHKVGDIVSGKITSIANFGMFVDIEGMEGLIHISRISQERVEDLNTLFKVGDTVESKIIEISKSKNRLGLSKKALEPSQWDKYIDEIKEGDIIPGTIKRFTDFGMYIEVKPGVDGLARKNEFSWSKRIKHPSDIYTAEQNVQVYVMEFKPDNKVLILSIKRTQPNPWTDINSKYSIGTEIKGTINQINPQGIVISFDEFDAFMPNSKARLAENNHFEIGENIEAKIADIVPEKETIILEPLHQVAPEAIPNRQRSDRNERSERDENERPVRRERSERRERPDRNFRNDDKEGKPEKYSSVNPKNLPTATPISFFDLLSEEDKAILLNQNSAESK